MDVASFVDELSEGIASSRRQPLIDETMRLIRETDGFAEGQRNPEPEEVAWLLGHTAERGLAKRARELLMLGEADVVAFGHTHEPVDTAIELPGRVGRVFNTGSWVPRIAVDPGSTPSLDELRKAPWVHDVRFLVLELGKAPQARLERLTR
ncbi:MAG: hypothetical protein L6Q76_28695 [Polyangiaceae bacterium]|nr:hypothetical protein [Polyangiaceae bacterium]